MHLPVHGEMERVQVCLQLDIYSRTTRGTGGVADDVLILTATGWPCLAVRTDASKNKLQLVAVRAIDQVVGEGYLSIVSTFL